PSRDRNSSHGSGLTMSKPLFPMAMPTRSSPTTTGTRRKRMRRTAMGIKNADVAMVTRAAKEIGCPSKRATPFAPFPVIPSETPSFFVMINLQKRGAHVRFSIDDTKLLWLALIVAAVWFRQPLAATLLPFILALALASLLEPVVGFLQGRARMPRAVAAI